MKCRTEFSVWALSRRATTNEIPMRSMVCSPSWQCAAKHFGYLATASCCLEPRPAILRVILGKAPSRCLESHKQLAIEFRFHGRAESILKTAQSPDDRLHAKTLTGKLSTNRSKASSLSAGNTYKEITKKKDRFEAIGCRLGAVKSRMKIPPM